MVESKIKNSKISLNTSYEIKRIILTLLDENKKFLDENEEKLIKFKFLFFNLDIIYNLYSVLKGGKKKLNKKIAIVYPQMVKVNQARNSIAHIEEYISEFWDSLEPITEEFDGKKFKKNSEGGVTISHSNFSGGDHYFYNSGFSKHKASYSVMNNKFLYIDRAGKQDYIDIQKFLIENTEFENEVRSFIEKY